MNDSVWRKRQIEDVEYYEIEQQDGYTSSMHTSFFDWALLLSGGVLCIISLGLTAGVGLGFLAIYARGRQ